jgi:DNA-binding MarR family transcriptional regulator
LGVVSEIEAELLGDLYRLKALAMRQVVERHSGDLGERALYSLVDRLAEKGFVRVRTAGWDKRIRYVVLTADGHALASEIAENGPPEDYRSPKEANVKRLLLANAFYIRAVKAGLSPEKILGRRELLEKLRVAPRDVPCLMWLADVGAGWAVHIPWKRRYRTAVDREIARMSTVKVQHHVIAYETEAAFNRDRARYVKTAPSSSLYLLPPDQVARWAAWLARSPRWTEDVGRMVGAAFPDAALLPPPPDSPGACLMRRNKDTLVVDMRFNRVGAVPLLARLIQSGFERRGWGSGVLLVFADLPQLKNWARHLGDWAWAVLEAEPGVLYRIAGGRPVVARRAQVSRPSGRAVVQRSLFGDDGSRAAR